MILLEWLGVDGSTWNLRTGEVRLGLGAQGFGLIPLTTFTQSNGVRDGQRATGWRAEPQTFQWPVKIGYAGWSSRQFQDFDRAWWKSCRPDLQGTIRATGADGTVRTVGARVTSDGPWSMDYDPSEVLDQDYQLTLVADDPWWRGPMQSTPYGVPATATPFYGAAGFGPPFYISAGNSSGSQPITNPGDTEAWPVWTITGPVSQFTITHPDGGQVAGAPALAAGERLVIDTRPGAKSATRYAADGTSVDWTPNLTAWDWRAIPAGTTQNISVALTGTGGATAQLQPRYFRAWS